MSENTKDESLSQRRELIGRSLSLGYDQPLKIVRGEMQYLYDETGRQYLDAYNNVPHVGHCHPRVVEAAYQQMKTLNTNTRYLHDNIVEFAAELTKTMGPSLKVCHFVNSGTEANELALRMMRTATGHKNIIVLEAAYHGNSTSMIDISPYKHEGPGGTGAPDWVHKVPLADTYRGEFKSDDPDAGKKYALKVKEKIDEIQSRGEGLAGFISESCPSVGGQIIFPDNYLSETYQHVRAAGGLCVADDVQTAYGRVGSDFYAYQAQDVEPDLLVLGKPIGNGHPLGAVIVGEEIADAFNNGMEYFNTFGGNTVSTAVGKTVLSVVQEEDLQAHAAKVGAHLLDGLKQIVSHYALAGDARGAGLFLGIELIKDPDSLEPAAAAASAVVNRVKEEGILIGTDGPFHNVVKIRPPMPFDMTNADRLLESLDKAIGQFSKQ